MSILLAGAIAGVVTLISSVSFAALMFSGKLTPFIAQGITVLVSTAVVAGSLFSLLSRCRPMVAMPDDDTAPVLALMVTLVLASFPADTPGEVLFITAFGALACTAIATGIALSALGFFRLGSLVRYLPYSVMGGYFAGRRPVADPGCPARGERPAADVRHRFSAAAGLGYLLALVAGGARGNTDSLGD